MIKRKFKADDGNYIDEYHNGYLYDCQRRWITFDKDTPFKTFLHYNEPDADKERDVFGSAKPGLFYNYSDRLYGDDWREGEKLATKTAQPNTARYYEICLNRFHHTDDVDLQHVILGCNRSTGYCYLIFGYTYTEKNL
jgi:hypothetical protein